MVINNLFTSDPATNRKETDSIMGSMEVKKAVTIICSRRSRGTRSGAHSIFMVSSCLCPIIPVAALSAVRPRLNDMRASDGQFRPASNLDLSLSLPGPTAGARIRG